MTKPNYILQTYIRCTPAQLWEVLRDAEAVIHYDFMGQSAKRKDGTLIYLAPDGSTTLHAREVEVVPMTRLVTTFEPKWAPDLETSQITYDIEDCGDYCKLTITHTGITPDDYEDVADGWIRSIDGLKTFIETGEPANFGNPEMWEA
jgi:hypothetical protein